MAILIILITGIAIYLLLVFAPARRKRSEWPEDSQRQIEQRWPEDDGDDAPRG
jgi:hypothetical protein